MELHLGYVSDPMCANLIGKATTNLNYTPRSAAGKKLPRRQSSLIGPHNFVYLHNKLVGINKLLRPLLYNEQLVCDYINCVLNIYTSEYILPWHCDGIDPWEPTDRGQEEFFVVCLSKGQGALEISRRTPEDTEIERKGRAIDWTTHRQTKTVDFSFDLNAGDLVHWDINDDKIFYHGGTFSDNRATLALRYKKRGGLKKR